jgi:hypothetical protein
MLDAAAPTRLFSGLPEGVQLERMGLVEAIEATAEFLSLPRSGEGGSERSKETGGGVSIQARTSKLHAAAPPP